MTAKFFMKLPDCFHRKAQVPARDEIRQNATPLVEGLHKKAELQFKVRNMQPTLLNFKRLQFSARHSASYQAALTIFSGTFAEHCIGRANENMREADELHGYVASFDYIIPLTRSGFASNVEEAASCVRNALECYLHCSGEVKEKLKPRMIEGCFLLLVVY